MMSGRMCKCVELLLIPLLGYWEGEKLNIFGLHICLPVISSPFLLQYSDRDVLR